MGKSDAQTASEAKRDKRRANASREILISHAVRCWEAEQENAARISEQRRWLAAAVVALLGLGLFRVEWVYDPEHVSRFYCWPAAVIVKLALAGAIYFFGMSLYLIYRTPAESERSRGRTASEQLSFQDSDATKPSRSIVLSRTYEAYLDLQERNVRHWDRLRDGQRQFGRGFILVLVALVVYLVSSVPPIVTKEVSDGPGGGAGNTGIWSGAEAHEAATGTTDSSVGAGIGSEQAGDSSDHGSS